MSKTRFLLGFMAVVLLGVGVYFAGAQFLAPAASTLDGSPMRRGTAHTADIVVVGTHADENGMLLAYRRPGFPNYADTVHMVRLDHWVPLATGERGMLTATAVLPSGNVQEYTFQSWRNATSTPAEACDDDCWKRLGAQFETSSAAPSH